MTSLVTLHVSGFFKKELLMIILLNFFKCPIKSLTFILKLVSLCCPEEISLQRMAFLFSKMDWSKRLKEADGGIVIRRCGCSFC